MARVVLPESKLRARRRRRRALLLYFCCGILVLLVLAAIALARAPFLKVSTIDISGESTVPADSIKTETERFLSVPYLFVFPKTNALLLPRQALRSDLLMVFPQLSDVTIHLGSLNDISITVSERAPMAQWCGDSQEIAPLDRSASSTTDASPYTASSCLLLDATGLVYAPALAPQTQDASGTPALLPLYGPLAGEGTQLPQQFLTPQLFSSTLALARAMSQDAHLGAARKVEIDESGTARISFENGFSVLFAATDDAGALMNSLASALQSPIFNGRSTADFQYLDLRFGDRLYYRLKPELRNTATTTKK